MAANKAKHADYTIRQWPDDLSTNFDSLSDPYTCYACRRPCRSIRALRTHNCKREKARV